VNLIEGGEGQEGEAIVIIEGKEKKRRQPALAGKETGQGEKTRSEKEWGQKTPLVEALFRAGHEKAQEITAK